MTKTHEFESVDSVRQLLRQVETRKSNFDYNLTLLERERDLLRLKSAWELLWHEGPDSERGRARYLVNKSIIASQSKVQKSVDKGLHDDSAKKQDPGGRKFSFRNEKSTRVEGSKFTTNARLLRAKASSCERCLKKGKQISPESKSRVPLKTADISAGKGKSVHLISAKNAMPPPCPQLSRKNVRSPQLSCILQPSMSTQQHFSTRSILSEKARRVEECRELKKQKSEVFIPLAIWQRNCIPTSCKATSTTTVPLSKNEDIRSTNIGFTSLQHETMKPELKIQVLPSVQIKPIHDSRPFVNVLYTELTSDNNKDYEESGLLPEPPENIMREKNNQSTATRTGKFPLTKELTEKVMAICKEKMMLNKHSEVPTAKSQAFADQEPHFSGVSDSGSYEREDAGDHHLEEDVRREVHVEAAKAEVNVEDAGAEVRNEDTGENTINDYFGENLQEEIADVSSEAERSLSLSKNEHLIPTPDLSPVSTPYFINQSILTHIVQTPPLSRLPSTDESESNYAVQLNSSVTEKVVYTPEQSLLESVSQPVIPEAVKIYPIENSAQFGASVAENVLSESLTSKFEISQPLQKRENVSSSHTETDYSIGQVRVQDYHKRKRPSNIEQRKDSEGSSASTPEGMEHFELEADLTNATISTSYSEGEVKPFRLHRLSNFDQMLSLLSRAQLSQLSSSSVLQASLGQSGFCFPPEVPRDGRRQQNAFGRHSPPDSKHSEMSLGEVQTGDQNRTQARLCESTFGTDQRVGDKKAYQRRNS